MHQKLVSITPHSTEPGPLAALDSTLIQLPKGGRLRRDADGLIAVNDGRVLCECGDADFVVFAVTAQGYARAAEVVPE